MGSESVVLGYFVQEIGERNVKRYWVSWEQPTDDYRPLHDPPNGNICGWWCSGQTGEDNWTLCAVVDAEDSDDAERSIRKDWPEAPFQNCWRFFEEKPLGWQPSNRFPVKVWMEVRL